MSRLMTVKEAADALGVHYNTMYRWIAAKEIGYIRLGRKHGVRISQEHIEQFIAKREAKPLDNLEANHG